MWGRDACGVLQEKCWGLQGFPLSPESFGVSPASGAFTDGVWRPWGLGQMSVIASARDPRGPRQPQLGSMLWLHQPPRGFLEPSPQHPVPPSPGRDGSALLSTWQVVPPQDYLLPHLPPHPQLEESPHSPLSATHSPLHRSHPAVGCDKGWGLRRHQHYGTQHHFAACACFPALTPLTLLRFKTQRAGSGSEPHLLPLQSPMPAVSPSLPAPRRTPPK